MTGAGDYRKGELIIFSLFNIFLFYLINEDAGSGQCPDLACNCMFIVLNQHDDEINNKEDTDGEEEKDNGEEMQVKGKLQ